MVVVTVKYIIRAFFWLATLVVLLFCSLAVRLYVAPVELDIAETRVSSQLQAFLPGWDISYQTGMLGWDSAKMRPWVTLDGVRAVNPNSGARVELPSLGVAMSRYLLSGHIGIASIQADRATIIIELPENDANAEVVSGGLLAETYLEPSGLPRRAAFRPITRFLLRSAETLAESAPDLDQASFNGTRIVVRRGEQSVSLSVPRLRAGLMGQDLSLFGQVRGEIGDRATTLAFEGRTERASQQAHLRFRIDDLTPSSLAEQFDGLREVAMFHLPLGLEFSGDLSAEKGLIEARASLHLGQGYLEDVDLYPRRASIENGLVNARYDPSKRVVFLETIALGLRSGGLRGEGVLIWPSDSLRPAISFEASLDHAKVQDLVTYWPFSAYENGRPRGGRAWLNKHMLDGDVSDVRVRLAVNEAGDGLLTNDSPFEVSFGFEDLDSYAVQTMSPIYEANGRGSVRLDKLEILVETGRIESLTLKDSRVVISSLHLKDEQVVDLDLSIAGEVRPLLALLDQQPIRAVERTNIPLERLSGRLDADGHIRIFVGEAVKQDTEFEIKADTWGLGASDILGGEGLTQGRMVLELTRDNLRLAGTGKLNGLDVELDWKENLKLAAENLEAETSSVAMTLVAPARDYQNIRVPLSRYVEGSVSSSGTFSGRLLRLSSGTFEADLTEAILRVPEIGWQKEAGIEARGKGLLTLNTDSTGEVSDLVVTGQEIDATLDVQWKEGGSGLTVQADARQLGRNQFTADVEQLEPENFAVDFKAQQYDLTPFLDVFEEHGVEQAVQQEPAQPIETRFTLKGQAERVILLNGEALQNMDLDLSFGQGQPQSVTLSGLMEGTGQPVALSLEDADGPDHPFDLTTEDAGGLLRGLGYFGNLSGGQLALNGQTRGWGNTLVLSANAEGGGSILLPTASLDPEVSIGTVSGIEEIVSEKGAKLRNIRMPFTYDRGLLDIDKLIANGDSVGLTLQGQMHVDLEQINMNGVYVPAFGLNSLLGNIPIIGALFRGGEGEGLIGFAFRVKGTVDNPQVQVSAASGLAPGFLRGVFKGEKGTIDSLTEEDLNPGSSEGGQ